CREASRGCFALTHCRHPVTGSQPDTSLEGTVWACRDSGRPRAGLSILATPERPSGAEGGLSPPGGLMRYVDGYVLPVPRRQLGTYLRAARKAGRIWRQHGALEYR